eukprot:1761525-Rhodomonas_salina.4
MEGFIPLLDGVAQSALGPSSLLALAGSPQGKQPLPSPAPPMGKKLDNQYDPTDTDIEYALFESLLLDLPVPPVLNISRPDPFSNTTVVIVKDNVKARADYLKLVLASNWSWFHSLGLKVQHLRSKILCTPPLRLLADDP